MTDLTKISGSQKHHLAISELVTASAIVFLLAAVQGMYIVKHPVTLNAAATAEFAPFGIAGP